MDWIRLTKSGKDLTGTGGRLLQVTSKELAKHNTRNDCWMALNGIVYNVTAYMDYHPGKTLQCCTDPLPFHFKMQNVHFCSKATASA